jgi:hypothetical protein
MRKTLLVSFLLAIGCTMTSQAVVISWASEALLSGTASAMLVFVSNGAAPTYSGGVINNGVELPPAASGYAIDGTTLYPQETTDGTQRSSGTYYVVLFDGAGQFAASTTSLAWNDSIISTDELDPISGTFTPGSFGEWQAVPEPSTAVLLCIGAAAAVMRRRKRV